MNLIKYNEILFKLYLDKSGPDQIVIEWYNTYFNSKESMINNWEVVYKKLIIKSIIELAGKLTWKMRRRGLRWDEGASTAGG